MVLVKCSDQFSFACRIVSTLETVRNPVSKGAEYETKKPEVTPIVFELTLNGVIIKRVKTRQILHV